MNRSVSNELRSADVAVVAMPKCSHAQALLSHRIAKDVVFALPDMHCLADLKGMVRCSEPEKEPDAALIMTLLLGSERVQVAWQSIALFAEQAGTTHGATFLDLPEQLQNIAAAQSVEPLLQILGQVVEQPVVVESIAVAQRGEAVDGEGFVSAEIAERAEVCSCMLSIHQEGKGCLAVAQVTFAADGVAHNALLHLLPQPRVEEGTSRELLMEISCIAGSQRLTRDEIASLRSGDVLLGAGSIQETQNALFSLRVGTTPVGMAVECEHGFEVVSFSPYPLDAADSRGEVEMEEAVELEHEMAEQSDETLADSIDTSTLELEVVFEVARAHLPLGELAQVSKGYIFTTDTSVDAPISIKAGNKEIGKGRLVSVADRVGIEIVDVAE